ncbi:hypothetical protein UF75_4637 [Desulfosporosinus sp. I2]|uniref:hypothetical protein n=1 Tax=Desulfosporosinus sp. I2 TaxID=1617025 RepID=UPI0005ED7FA1|nr:hypothetical protein [Desulfosporosinus sp. I2]KJR44977.1 hypothetical protein UF75_4637 [Desulfosporosinus sp. I2]
MKKVTLSSSDSPVHYDNDKNHTLKASDISNLSSLSDVQSNAKTELLDHPCVLGDKFPFKVLLFTDKEISKLEKTAIEKLEISDATLLTFVFDTRRTIQQAINMNVENVHFRAKNNSKFGSRRSGQLLMEIVKDKPEGSPVFIDLLGHRKSTESILKVIPILGEYANIKLNCPGGHWLGPHTLIASGPRQYRHFHAEQFLRAQNATHCRLQHGSSHL